MIQRVFCRLHFCNTWKNNQFKTYSTQKTSIDERLAKLINEGDFDAKQFETDERPRTFVGSEAIIKLDVGDKIFGSFFVGGEGIDV